MRQTFYSNGKLLITGEYTVLDGAAALALPTKQGQYLHVEQNNTGTIEWLSKEWNGTEWFAATLPIAGIIANDPPTDDAVYSQLVAIMHHAHMANPAILTETKGFTVTTELTFPREWGLGTSSTLINNIAQWFGINAFDLLNKSFGGSGYDIACAQHNTPLTYRLEDGRPIVTPVPFHPAFADKLWFVYLNQKQDSRKAIAAYRSRQQAIAPTVEVVNIITSGIVNAENLSQFCILLEEHEALLSEVLGQPTVKQALFPDFKGTLKSLGAWGGDFILAVGEEDPTRYFKNKGYTTIIAYNGIILK